MRVRVIAVGTRPPAWVRTATDQYLQRLAPLPVSLMEITAGLRRAGGPAQQAIATEGKRLLGALRSNDHVTALDERGSELSTRELAAWLGKRMQEGRDLAFLIGGPDGFAPQVLARSDFRLSLSRLTLPHSLVRVLLAEQLYRAHSILGNHPYHRD
ncbi:MAG: 23S rRNA (pseudouridine(1915)-N(3))-methyltransferase RlmH [Steroidobacteraceae bacterium]